MTNDITLNPQLSTCTDYTKGTGSPEPYLKRLSEAGFTHVLWGHHWNTDFIYSKDEIAQIKSWFKKYNLKLLDIHGSEGQEKNWFSTDEASHRAGIELIINRLEMAQELGGRTVVMHLQVEKKGEEANKIYWNSVYKAFDALTPHIIRTGVRIALENSGLRPDNFPAIKRILKEYPASIVGLCYDSGHGALKGDGLDNLDEVKDRLIALHLNDNDYSDDTHAHLFSGIVDWERHAKIIAESSYELPVNLEVTMNVYPQDEEADFLKKSFDTGMKFTQMIEDFRKTAKKE